MLYMGGRVSYGGLPIESVDNCYAYANLLQTYAIRRALSKRSLTEGQFIWISVNNMPNRRKKNGFQSHRAWREPWGLVVCRVILRALILFKDKQRHLIFLCDAFHKNKHRTYIQVFDCCFFIHPHLFHQMFL